MAVAAVQTDPPLLPAAFERWFAARGWQPHPHQIAMLEAAQNGSHALLVAPTGGGKTLAGFLPTLTELSRIAPHGLHTLYVSPLKALAQDIARNLERPIREMGLDIRTETRTGDTSAKQKLSQRVAPPHILLTTPESLSLLLSYPEAAKIFASLRTVIIDELHAFAPTKRGQLLALALSRVSAIAPAARRVGLSATIRDVDAYRRWLAPGGDEGRVRLVTGRAGAEPEIRILIPEARIPWAGHLGRHALAEIYHRIAQHRTTLVFVNTRASAELVFQELWHLNEDGLEIALHHGSLDREHRQRVEAAMAAGSLRAVVCTSSLDLGIDWGDVDLVIQLGAPKGASRLLQRIGRANHRFDTPSKALLVPANRFEFLECQAALEAVRAHDLDADEIGAGALDVLAQHLMGLACAAPFDPDETFAEVTRAAPYRALSRADFVRTLGFVENGGYALKAYARYRRIKQSADGRYFAVSAKVERQHRLNAGTIVAAPTLAVQYRGGRKLGEVEEYFALSLVPGDVFPFSGRLLRFEGLRETTLIVSAARQAQSVRVPVYAGGRLPLSTNLADRVRELIATPRQWGIFPKDVHEWLHLQRSISTLPAPGRLLVETFPRGTGPARRQFLVAYSFEGRNAHQSLGLLITRRMERLGLKPLGFVGSDYVLAVWSMERVEDPAPLFASDLLDEELREWMAESALMKRSFRNVAVISGLLERKYPGVEKTGRQMTVSSDLIYDVLRRYDPEHVLMDAAWAEAGGRLTDLDRLAGFLKRVQGRIDHKRLRKISPFAVPVMLEIGKEAVYGEALDSILLEEEAIIRDATEPGHG